MNKIISSILLNVIAVLVFFQVQSCRQRKEDYSLLQAKQTELEITRNAKNEEVAKRLVLVGSIDDIKNSMKSKYDSLINDLQAQLNKTTLSLTLIKNKTVTTHETASQVGLNSDTVRIDSFIYVYPEYKTSFSDKWEQYEIRAGKDSIHHSHVMYNYFTVEQKYVKQGLFKPNLIQLQITNSNPNTTTVDAQSFLIKPKKENKLFWHSLTFLAGFIGASVLNR